MPFKKGESKMSKNKIILIIVSVAAVILGAIVGICGLAAIDFDLTKLNTSKYKTSTYSFAENFNDINIDVGSANIEFKPSKTDICEVECYDDEKVKYDVNVTNDTLNIKYENSKSWNIYFGINFSGPRITISLPEKDYNSLYILARSSDVNVPNNLSFLNSDVETSSGEISYFADTKENLNLKSNSGDITAENVYPENFNAETTSGEISVLSSTVINNFMLESNSGDISLNDVNAFNINAESNSGEIRLINTVASGSITAKATSGDIDLMRSDAEEIHISTSSGEVSGSLLSDKTFVTDTNSGDVNVPVFSGSDNVCEIKTNSGDIDMTVD